MSEKWIPWKSRLISIMGGEDNLTQASFNALSFFVYFPYLPLYSQNHFGFSILCPRPSPASQVSWAGLQPSSLFLIEKESDLYILSFHDFDQFLDRIVNEIQLSPFQIFQPVDHFPLSRIRCPFSQPLSLRSQLHIYNSTIYLDPESLPHIFSSPSDLLLP